MTEAERLSKRLIQLTSCSRREAELYIEGGWVTVNGQVVEEPQHPVTDEQVALLPGAKAETQLPVTLLLHKPVSTGQLRDAMVQLITQPQPTNAAGSAMQPVDDNSATTSGAAGP